jgi:hypothetical protein
MIRLSRVFPFVLSFVALAIPSLRPALADEEAVPPPPILMLLQYNEKGKRQSIKIEAKGGETVSPAAGKREDRWWVGPGEALKTAKAPDDRLIELYRGKGSEHILLCAFKLRFTKTRDGFVPKFQLIEVPLAVRQGDRWVPFLAPAGSAGNVVIHGSVLPDADGFYPTLEFGFTGGPVAIDSWVLR